MMMSDKDYDDRLHNLLADARRCIAGGNEDKAEEILHGVLKQTKKGMVYSMATQALGEIYYKQGKKQEAYEMLMAERKRLPLEALEILHKLAYEIGEYNRAIDIGNDYFRVKPVGDVAFTNALAHAQTNTS